MKKHLSWIIVVVMTIALIVGLHFLLFAPLKSEYEASEINLKSTSVVGCDLNQSMQHIG